jgi:aminopeptidase-like protein
VRIEETVSGVDFDAAGREMYDLIAELYPVCRSITGDGVRRTLDVLGRGLELTREEVPTGTRVFDWVVPREWNVADAWVATTGGERLIDFRRSNLHVLQYSTPIRRRVGRAELAAHLHSLPEHPRWIPYRTSYYEERWGFCVEHERLTELNEEEYDVCIDSTLADGHLTYGEYVIPGASEEEFLFSCHVCHPSLCNDNLSGIALTAHLARLLTGVELRHSYRFLFVPGTIGAITWLSRNETRVQRIRHGLVVACVGDGGKLRYKRSRRGSAAIDRAVEHVLRHSGGDCEIRDFSPYGYDERQYCSPGFDLPVGSLTRTPHGCFAEYHTSADDLDFVAARHLAESLRRYLEVIDVIENDARYANTNPKCEPQLGRRGLYRTIGGFAAAERTEMAALWVLNLSDGGHSLLDIAERAGVDFATVRRAAGALLSHGLLEKLAT